MIDIRSFRPPQSPGVYIFKDKYGENLYIGKAKNLKKRIYSYSTNRQIDWKIESLLSSATLIDWIITETEQDALLMEADLISSYKPLYNRLLTGDMPFTYIVGNAKKNKLPFFKLSRAFENIENNFAIGPFLEYKTAKKILDYILQEFKLGICNKSIERGCLSYHLGSCSGICMPNFNKKAYSIRYELAQKALSSDSQEFIKELTKKIEEEKKEYNFQEAQELHYYLTHYQQFMNALYSYAHYDDIFIEEALIKVNIDNNSIQTALVNLKNLLHMTQIPAVIDCIDISHFQGHALIGAVVRFVNGVYDRTQTKTYRFDNKNNDYEAIQNTLLKYYEEKKLPDVLLIDGGKGQLSTAIQIINNIPVIALAKKEERLYTKDHKEGIVLSTADPMGILLMSLRNNTHNVAILNHRKNFVFKN